MFKQSDIDAIRYHKARTQRQAETDAAIGKLVILGLYCLGMSIWFLLR